MRRQSDALAQGVSEENAALCCHTPLDVFADPGCALYEFSPSVYEGAEADCAGTVGVVFFGRQTGENLDAWSGAYDDGTAHMLALTSSERELLRFAKDNCESVVVVICSSSAMELAALEDDPDVDAILWLGGAGSTGYVSLAAILRGAVTPSGRTPVTFAADFHSDPTFANHDIGSWHFVYEGLSSSFIGSTSFLDSVSTAFQEIEEGVYLGYRYYETARVLGALEYVYDRARGVVYPFGYGLSYTSFSQTITGVRTQGQTVYVGVRVRNEGDRYAGKEVVQLYVSPPYTSLDVHYGIEKPAASLIAFAKTSLLGPGEEELVDVVLPCGKPGFLLLYARQ